MMVEFMSEVLWIPAFTGMTVFGINRVLTPGHPWGGDGVSVMDSRLRGNDGDWGGSGF